VLVRPALTSENTFVLVRPAWTSENMSGGLSCRLSRHIALAVDPYD